MTQRLLPVLIAALVAAGCSGSSAKLSEKSEDKLAKGDAWKAWELAVRALDKEPGNPRAREAATAAGASIVQEWQRTIRATAELDSLRAAEQVLDLVDFRVRAARYATIPVGEEWPAEEKALRHAAARAHYRRGQEAAQSGRPKRAHVEFIESDRFVAGYRDVIKRADRALQEAMTRVALVPFRASADDPSFGVQVAQAWRAKLGESLAPPAARFTRILGSEAIERAMSVSELDGLSRAEAVRVARVAGAQRVIWGSIGAVKSSTKLNVFRDTVVRRAVETDGAGREHVRWIDVPIEVIARVRDVTVGLDYEVITTRSGVSVAQRHLDRSMQARVVWTSYQPEGDPASYSLVSEVVRASNPDRARDVEARWRKVCGDATTLVQVLEARRASGSSGRSAKDVIPRILAGAAFVFLEDLPSAEDLAHTALSQGSGPLRDDLLRIDAIDDVDLMADLPEGAAR